MPGIATTRRVPHGLRVLVVDDNATNRQILAEWLRGWQMEAAAVCDGLAALDALWDAVGTGRPYALVLLDARMPDIDGLALAAKIRKRAELSDTRLVVDVLPNRPDLLSHIGVAREIAALTGKEAPPELVAKHAVLLAAGFRYRRLRSSMLAAIERGRPPAVDFLNGEVVRHGERLGVPTKVNRAATELVWRIARGEERSSIETLTALYAATR